MKQELSISKLVKKVVDNHPTISDCLKNKLLNYTSTAKLIKPEIEKITGSEVSLESVKMALIRYSDEVSKDRSLHDEKIRKVIAETTLQLRNEVVVLTIRWETFVTKFDKILNVIKNSRFFQITQGIDTFSMVLEKKNLFSLMKVISKEEIIEIIEDQSAIVLQSPKEIITTPGVISFITNLFFKNGINLTQVISCYLDTIFIVNSKDALIGYQLLEETVNLIRRKYK